jgi:hypothetical protein
MKAIVSLRLIQHTAVTAEGLEKDAIVKSVVEKLQATYDKVEVIDVQEITKSVGSVCERIVANTGLAHDVVASILEEQ